MSAHDFDFLHGDWRIDHRKLKERLADCQDWERFTTELTCRPILGGTGNMDEGHFPASGYHAATIRLYDPKSRLWSLYWITSASSVIDPPQVGRFTDGVGDFLGPDTHNGIPVLVRYRWTVPRPGTARWEQAFSTDDGATWETNWIMNLTRR